MNAYSATIITLTFVLGVCTGSFLNVLIYRLGSGTRLTGRSKCLSCGKILTTLMLVPLLSFLVLRGRCGHCGATISPQYPIVEATAGLLFILVAAKNGLLLTQYTPSHVFVAGIEAAIWAVLLVVLVYDWKHKIIPDKLAFTFALLSGLLLSVRMHYGMTSPPYLPFLDTVPTWADWLAAPLVALPLALVWLATLGRGMGLGDAKLAWGIGWFLGLTGAVTAVVLSFWIAFVPSVALLFLRAKRFTMKSEIPFAPFLILGTFVAYTFGVNILSWTF